MRCHSVACGMASQTQLGFESAPIVERLRGQGYGDFPWRGVHFFSTAQSTNCLSDTIERSQPLPKNFEIATCVIELETLSGNLPPPFP